METPDLHRESILHVGCCEILTASSSFPIYGRCVCVLLKKFKISTGLDCELSYLPDMSSTVMWTTHLIKCCYTQWHVQDGRSPLPYSISAVFRHDLRLFILKEKDLQSIFLHISSSFRTFCGHITNINK